MPNTLYLPELREMLAEQNSAGLREFCDALHPARTAEYMEGLTVDEAWEVLRHTDSATRVEIFRYIEPEAQVAAIETMDREQVAQLLSDLPNDECVDLLNDVDPSLAAELLPLLPTDERREILRLQAYPEDTAGAVMTTEFARVNENQTAREALEDVGRQAEELETIYYLYVVDEEDHLRGIVSARQLVAAMGKSDVRVRDLVERDVVSADVDEDREQVAHKVADYDLLAIPVVDDEHRMVGIVTHDDVIDVVREEMAEDAHLRGGIDPLDEGYLETRLLQLAWKRGIWLTIFFFGALLTAFLLGEHDATFRDIGWLVIFIPLVISSGGNSGNQSATLVITALATGDIQLKDWWHVVRRELAMGLMLGGFLGAIGFLMAWMMTPDIWGAVVVALTLLLVAICGTLSGSVLPLLFSRLGLDPAMMSNPFVACLIDILGILIYMQVALWLL